MKHFVGMQKGEYKALKVNYKKVVVLFSNFLQYNLSIVSFFQFAHIFSNFQFFNICVEVRQ